MLSPARIMQYVLITTFERVDKNKGSVNEQVINVHQWCVDPQKDQTLCIDQMLLLIFSVILSYCVITMNQHCSKPKTSFPTGTVFTLRCIVLQALDFKKVRGPEPQRCDNFHYIKSLQKATSVFNKGETHSV